MLIMSTTPLCLGCFQTFERNWMKCNLQINWLCKWVLNLYYILNTILSILLFSALYSYICEMKWKCKYCDLLYSGSQPFWFSVHNNIQRPGTSFCKLNYLQYFTVLIKNVSEDLRAECSSGFPLFLTNEFARFQSQMIVICDLLDTHTNMYVVYSP